MNFVEALSSAATQGNEERFRYYGAVAGVVTDANDSDGLCRVKARLKGMHDNTETGWLTPLFPGGIEGVPHKSDPVMVFFEDGNENRGAYLWWPASKTNDRPNEWLVLGLTFAAMYNHLVSLVNELRTAHNTHKHTGVFVGAGTSAVPDVTVATAAAGKMQKADGSEVSASSSSAKALSGRVKVGI